METEQGTKTTKGKFFWNAVKIGDSIKGLFKGFFETKNGIAMKLELGDKTEKFVGVSTTLQKPIQDNIKSFNAKSMIQIQYIGQTEKKYKGGNKAKLYEIYCNDKELLADFSYDEIKPEKLAEFFNKKKKAKK